MPCFRVKQRDAKHPVLLIVAGVEQVSVLASAVSDRARACMNAFWPLSLLLPGVSTLPKRLLDEGGPVLRALSRREIARDLCRQ